MIVELPKVGLDTSGTTEVLRKRLINYLMGGELTPIDKTDVQTMIRRLWEYALVVPQYDSTIKTNGQTDQL